MKTITITKQGGRAEWSTPPQLAADLLRNGTYDVTITQRREGTKAQARLLWMWLGCIQQSTGDKSTDLYKFYCGLFLRQRRTVYGMEVEVTGTTGELDKAGMTAFLDNVRADAMERLGIRLPLPEDRMFEQFSKTYG